MSENTPSKLVLLQNAYAIYKERIKLFLERQIKRQITISDAFSFSADPTITPEEFCQHLLNVKDAYYTKETSKYFSVKRSSIVPMCDGRCGKDHGPGVEVLRVKIKPVFWLGE